uniref:Protein MON2 homolog n=1 Tax=Hydra vulgaris TaxID=6087 RepID=T2MA63_HYDVU
MSNSASAKKLVEDLLIDFKNIHGECRKKYPNIKEALDIGIVRLRMMLSSSDDIISSLSTSSEVFTAIFFGLESKFSKVLPICLTSVQRLALAAAVGEVYATKLVSHLSTLVEDGFEDLRVLQTVIVLLTTSDVVQKDSLAQTIVLCFKLYFNQDTTTSNTASAAIRQVIAVVVDRMIEEDKKEKNTEETVSSYHVKCPQTLRPKAQDAYLLFQDLCQLTNGDNPYWMQGMKTMTRTFGLELMESILKHYPQAFLDHPEFCYLLKERVCPLIIKLFSPNIKYKISGVSTPTIIEKPLFSLSVRLLRVVSVLIKQFYTLLITECEIFLSLLVKFLDSDKPFWQRTLSLEVLQSLCQQPQILRSFCEYYDMQEHSTKIFEQICKGLGMFICSLFCNDNSGQLNTTSNQNNGSPVDKMGNQSGFIYNGVWIPVTTLLVSKSIYLDQLDYKNENVNVSESYGMQLACSTVLHICNAIDILILKRDSIKKRTESNMEVKDVIHHDKTGLGSESFKYTQPLDVEPHIDMSACWHKMIENCWKTMLSTLSLLLEASTDEQANEQILKGMQIFASVCGQLQLNSCRDAFIASICKMALPSGYNSNNLNSTLSKLLESLSSEKSPDSLSNTGSIIMTVKNVECMRALLNLSHCHGCLLGTAWHIILLTLQHLTQILGLKLSTGGTSKTIQPNEIPNLDIPQALNSDLPVLSSMLSRLFESSQYLDDVGLHHLVDALCRLSMEHMESATNNKEPSLFGVAKMLETGLVNLNRLHVLWKPLTAHLLEVSQHPHARLREWGADALTELIKMAVFYEHVPSLAENLPLQLTILYPLQEMALISYSGVRQLQFECVLNILQECAPKLGAAWPVILRIIGSATNQQNEAIIRLGFQSLQLVVTDFLPIIPCWCVHVLVEVIGKFGLQQNEINISLTAVGLLWNLSDFLYQNRASLKHELEKYVICQPELTQHKEANGLISPIQNKDLYPSLDNAVSPFDSAWMSLYSKLGELCVDPRPAVRKSAGQTLFSTISAHGGLLENATWYSVLWKVLFPLLQQVKAMSSAAADCPPPSDNTTLPGNILIHHSRDTAEKQWAETCVLSLAGVSRVFSNREHVLRKLSDYPRAWALLLEIIEGSALSKNAEVALNSLKSFQEIVKNNMEEHEEGKIPFLNITEQELDLWINAWRVWQNIGTYCMDVSSFVRNSKDSSGKISNKTVYPSQAFLTALVNIFPPLLGRIYGRFGIGDLERLGKVLERAVSMPLHSDTSPFLLPAFHHETTLSPLQKSVLQAISTLLAEVPQLNNKSILDHNDNLPMYPTVFTLLLHFIEFACCPPKVETQDNESYTQIRGRAGEWVVMNYVPLAEHSMKLVQTLYEISYAKVTVVKGNVLKNIIKTLHLPLKLKYACPAQSTWKLSIELLLNVLKSGLKVHLNNKDDDFQDMWMSMASAFDDFLFSLSPPPDSQTLAEHRLDEQIDIKLVKLIRQDILPFASSLPKVFVDRLMKLLNKGSIHSATTDMFDSDSVAFPFKEDFAKLCFETLLQYSFFKDTHNKEESELSRLALQSLLERCKSVLCKYSKDERLNGQFPLPRTRMFEMSFAVKAIATLLASIKKMVENKPNLIDDQLWRDLIGLYPTILECITCSSEPVRHALKEALLEFQDLLSPPKSLVINGS